MKSILHSFAILLFSTFIFIGCEKEVKNPPVANAGDSQNVPLKNEMFILIGSGSSHQGRIAGYIWSLVSGPNVPVIASPSSPTTNINRNNLRNLHLSAFSD